MTETWIQSTARNLVFQILKRIEQGRLTIVTEYESGKNESVSFGSDDSNSEPEIVVVIKNPQVFVRLCQAFDLGLSESYMVQDVDCDNLIGLFSLYVKNQHVIGASGGNFLYTLIPRAAHYLIPSNDTTNALKNASFHYDTSNNHFAGFLSPDMNYSSAIWSGEPGESLESAQRRKIQNILDKAEISPSHHVLDIGCGWGNLAITAVQQTGCRVTGLTLSKEQKITILLCDYRKAPVPKGGYDRIISIEMLEHVGDKYMNKYFQHISNYLVLKGGRMVVQGITRINPYNSTGGTVENFIDRYIFPGGYLPSINQLLTSIHNGSQGHLEVETVQSIGPHYIRTLQCWRENFDANWESIRQDFVAKNASATETAIEAYRRQWVYYFQYCEAGFRTRILGDYVISATRTPWPEIPANVPH
ncbi:cyclopropane-fatty-acyl-phospholipid synthase [Trichoderma citrinoviride]|uniref:Cyclopropane-fatty-acyl-phospholipid synthase n=1 Tax=Trichoderma citrinoviride TaxID=58853 RepID=A0A2T4BGN0_9HYPO|nr:cyclopropane-fatty-acyl-phospholipid synthase [Trichoderma citrinoviride]PTB68462.1 cyclopropane-fatty-acyl-phospholipid synthase [Trichoderma citrinoviride]